MAHDSSLARGGASATSLAPVEIYCASMEDVKRRLQLVRRVGAGALLLGAAQFDAECVALQFRKILDLVALGSLRASADKYLEVAARFESPLDGAQLLGELRRVHPDHYPQPVRTIDVTHVREALAPRDAEFLSEDQFVDLYDKCSEVLFSRPSHLSSRVDLLLPVAEWADRIQSLLSRHCMRLAGTPDRWMVVLQNTRNGRVVAVRADELDAGCGAPAASESESAV